MTLHEKQLKYNNSFLYDMINRPLEELITLSFAEACRNFGIPESTLRKQLSKGNLRLEPFQSNVFTLWYENSKLALDKKVALYDEFVQNNGYYFEDINPNKKIFRVGCIPNNNSVDNFKKSLQNVGINSLRTVEVPYSKKSPKSLPKKLALYIHEDEIEKFRKFIKFRQYMNNKKSNTSSSFDDNYDSPDK